MNQLKSRPRETRIDMGIRGPITKLEEFVGWYQDIFDSFESRTRDMLMAASDRAFEDVLEYDRAQSENVAQTFASTPVADRPRARS